MNRTRIVASAWALVASMWTLVASMTAGCHGEPSGSDDARGDAARATVQSAGAGAAESLTTTAEWLPERVVPELKPITPEEGGMALFSGIVRIDAAEDATYCTYAEGTTSEVGYIHEARGTQSRFGHHVVLLYAPNPEPPGTRECGPMEKYRRILGGSGGDSTPATMLPGNVVSEIPAGSQFVLQHHWINVSEQAADVQAMIATVPPDTQDGLVIARSMQVVALGWELLPGAESEHTVECEFRERVSAVSILGHEHEWGTWVKAERLGPDGSVDVILDHEFLYEYANNPKRFYFDISDPLTFDAGDRIRFTCTWLNSTSETIKFPREMCVFSASVLAETDLTCVNGAWMGKIEF